MVWKNRDECFRSSEGAFVADIWFQEYVWEFAEGRKAVSE